MKSRQMLCRGWWLSCRGGWVVVVVGGVSGLDHGHVCVVRMPTEREGNVHGAEDEHAGGAEVVQRLADLERREAVQACVACNVKWIAREGGLDIDKRTRPPHAPTNQSRQPKRTGGGLVAEEDLRVGHHAAHQGEPALLPAAQAPDHDAPR